MSSSARLPFSTEDSISVPSCHSFHEVMTAYSGAAPIASCQRSVGPAPPVAVTVAGRPALLGHGRSPPPITPHRSADVRNTTETPRNR